MSREDLNALFDTAVNAAQQMLGKHGEFFPFGVTMSHEGMPGLNMADLGEEQPQSQEVIAFLKGAFRKAAEEKMFRAIGICFDACTIPPGQNEKTDAICVQLEHQDGDAIDVYLPYKKGFLKRYKYGEAFACKGNTCVFSTSEDNNKE